MTGRAREAQPRSPSGREVWAHPHRYHPGHRSSLAGRGESGQHGLLLAVADVCLSVHSTPVSDFESWAGGLGRWWLGGRLKARTRVCLPPPDHLLL